MQNYQRNLFLAVFSAIILFAGLGCLKLTGYNNNNSDPASGNAANPEQTKIDIERIKHYRQLIEDTLPFKDIIWDAGTSGEPIRNMFRVDNFIYTETTASNLRAYNSDMAGHPQWVVSLNAPLKFPICSVAGLPPKQSALRQEVEKLRKQVADAELESGRDEAKVSKLKSQLRSTEELLNGLMTNDVIYYITEDVLYCVKRWWGTELWHKSLGFVPRGAPVASMSAVYISALDFNRVYIFDITKRYASNWLKLPAPVTTSLFYKEPVIYFACDDGVLYCFSAETQKMMWSYPTKRTIKSDLLLAEGGDMIYVGGTDFTLYAIDRNAGAAKWKYETGVPITSPLALGIRRVAKENQVIVERTLFFKTDEKEELQALLINPPPSSGTRPYQLRWTFAPGKIFWMYGLACAYVLGNDNQTLYALDIEKGTILNQYSLRDFPFRVVDAEKQILYLGTADGYIFAVQELSPKY